MNHLTLWNAVVSTDPNYTKKFTRGGGFSGTATNFVYLARKATEQLGPCGIGWGSKVLDERYERGAMLNEHEHEVVHVIRIVFWYMLDGKRGEIESYGQTTFVGSNKNGSFTDEEAPKKSLTDAMSKAMSWLGFGADIHLGLFDDNKYVNTLKREFGTGKSATVEAPAETPVALGPPLSNPHEQNPSREPGSDDESMFEPISSASITEWGKSIKQAKTLDELRQHKDTIFSACQATPNGAGVWRTLKAEISSRKAELEAGNG